MMSYNDLSIPFRSLIILSLFLELCVGGCMLPAVFRRKRLLPKFHVILSMVCVGVMMIIYTAEARANLRNLEIPKISEWLCSRSIIIPLLMFVVVLFGFAYLITKEVQFRKKHYYKIFYKGRY